MWEVLDSELVTAMAKLKKHWHHKKCQEDIGDACQL